MICRPGLPIYKVLLKNEIIMWNFNITVFAFSLFRVRSKTTRKSLCGFQKNGNMRIPVVFASNNEFLYNKPNYAARQSLQMFLFSIRLKAFCGTSLAGDRAAASPYGNATNFQLH